MNKESIYNKQMDTLNEINGAYKIVELEHEAELALYNEKLNELYSRALEVDIETKRLLDELSVEGDDYKCQQWQI